MVVSLFCTPENGILIQDSFPLNEEYECLLGIEVPYHYFVRKVSSAIEGFSIPDFIHYIYFPLLILEKEPELLNKGTTGTIFITSLV